MQNRAKGLIKIYALDHHLQCLRCGRRRGFNFDLEISLAPPAPDRRMLRPLDEDFDAPAEELPAEIEAVLLGPLGQDPDAVARDLAGDKMIRPPRRRRPRPGRERERVRVDEADAVDDVESLREVFVGLAGKAGDDVGRNRRAVEGGVDPIDHAQEIVATVLAVHSLEDSVGAALQGEVEVRDDLSMRA
jgi:hypothetical protein